MYYEIEDTIFKNYTLNQDKLIPFGFIKKMILTYIQKNSWMIPLEPILPLIIKIK